MAFTDLTAGLASLGIDQSRPVIAHASLKSFGKVLGGAEAVANALVTRFAGVMMPAFTYKTMIYPPKGPSNNGLDYGSRHNRNLLAAHWDLDMHADRLMGAVPEALRLHRKAQRSSHPILSFTGIGVDHLLGAQRLEDPLAPIEALIEEGGWVLLMGVDHSVNTSLHVAEQRAGRKSFVRWALTGDGVKTCPRFPACSNGFVELEAKLAPLTKSVWIGKSLVRALPAGEMVRTASHAFQEAPRGYLCKRMDCGRCSAVRSGV